LAEDYWTRLPEALLLISIPLNNKKGEIQKGEEQDKLYIATASTKRQIRLPYAADNIIIINPIQ
jgi:hypothetical protein